MILVVDASIVIKWFVEEIQHDEARRLLGYREILQAPDLVLIELMNVLWKKVRRGEIAREQATMVASTIHHYIPVLYPSQEMHERALEIALDLGHPVYDCLYLACAERVGGILITADERLCRAVSVTGLAPLVRHLMVFDAPLDAP